MPDPYAHGHHERVLRSHRWRTAENSAAYLLPLLQSLQAPLFQTLSQASLSSLGKAILIGGLPHGFYLFERQRLLFRLGLSLRLRLVHGQSR